MLMSYQGSFLPPGQLPSIEAIEQDLTSVVWNRLDQLIIGSNALIDGASRDAGNTGHTTVLRPGLLMTLSPTTGKWLPWGTETDFATDLIGGVMLMAQQMERHGVDQDRWLGYILLGGQVKSNGLCVHDTAGSSFLGHAQETVIRTQMKYGFRFDDDPLSHLAS